MGEALVEMGDTSYSCCQVAFVPVAKKIVTACQGELPLRSCFSLWTSLDGQDESANLSGRVVQTPWKITAAMAFCQALEHALRSPPVALRSRRSDAVGSWEVFESYMHHTLRTSPCQNRIQMSISKGQDQFVLAFARSSDDKFEHQFLIFTDCVRVGASKRHPHGGLP